MRIKLIIVAVLSLLGSFEFVGAADAPPAPKYAALATAQRGAAPKDGEITVSVQVVNRGARITAPRVTVVEGQSATIESGTKSANGQLSDGVHIDVISVAGTDEVILLTTLREKGLIVWAETRTIPVAQPN